VGPQRLHCPVPRALNVLVRLGAFLPFKASNGNGNDLLAYVGYQAVVLPVVEPTVHGPTAGVGIRSWPRGGGWGWQVNTGLWLINRRLTCDNVCPNGDGIVLPEVRLAFIRAR
jgi:hypothetical protein